MKYRITLAMMSVLFIIAAGCNKPQENLSAKVKADAQASTNQVQRACNFVTLSGSITTNTTLSAANIYKISGIVVVSNNATLTIPAGTVLEGIKSTTSPAWLVIEKGSKLVATGNSASPIIFTSDQAAGSRAAGDWGGIAFAGEAVNNNSNSLDIQLSSTYTLNGGGTTNTDNSGNLQFVQIHYAGAGYLSTPSQSGLILNSVGSGTSIDHVQVSNSKYDGVGIYGGVVSLNNIVSYHESRTDFPISLGYRGNMQFLAAMRLSNSAIPIDDAYGINVTNNDFDASATPFTQPVISNSTLMGPNHCSSTGVDNKYIAAIRISESAAGKVYNTVMTSWNATATSSGLLIDDNTSIGYTASNDLQFSYNSFDNSGTTPYSSASQPWSGGCSLTMAAWIGSVPGGSPLCRETGNQFSVATLGYDASFCDDFCGSSFNPNFVLGSGSTLSVANFGWDTGSAFSHVTYRGAFGSSDFTANWAEWCPQNVVYCS